jgi:anti-sigma factor RsiW
MMNHNELQMLVSSSFDKEMMESERKIVEDHLAACPACRKFLEEAAWLRSEVQGLADQELSSTFSRTVMRSIESQEDRQVEWMGIEAFARHAFYAIALVVMLTFIISGFDSTAVSTSIDPVFVGFESDSTSHGLLISQEISKEDILYSVMTR